ncbi:uncharacterized protein CC84DRAFT_222390 [Paraphaeosphaeria sporulosa]|uniref:Uncharacterized protein n=1 Tax=Paraphaeosphaeria sporulosa TaxID=1460663 RepID=A0A177C557_9PLEO|nr:uncharacterized protein CC84DRAFT_222390 [Paraphaeosphaeria sporulosa]OAG01810.1 hypothetical protein CC84DRAFT_222390 [Paraphaeosphaeria sporulosa]
MYIEMFPGEAGLVPLARFSNRGFDDRISRHPTRCYRTLRELSAGGWPRAIFSRVGAELGMDLYATAREEGRALQNRPELERWRLGVSDLQRHVTDSACVVELVLASVPSSRQLGFGSFNSKQTTNKMTCPYVLFLQSIIPQKYMHMLHHRTDRL